MSRDRAVAMEKIFIAGHNGLVGSSILRKLRALPTAYEILTAERYNLDLEDQRHVEEYIQEVSPNLIIIAAAKVGGILANVKTPYDFLSTNLKIQTNLISAALGVRGCKVIFLGSSCIYPRELSKPIKEDKLLSGYLEKTNEAYAIAKIAGIKMCEAARVQYNAEFISLMPCNLYGPNDNFDPETSHVLPALMRKVHLAKEKKSESITVWGDGSPLREFLYVDDLADVCCKLIEKDYLSLPSLINVGSSQEISIEDLTYLISEVLNWEGRVIFDKSKPNGVQRKKLDCGVLNTHGWMSETTLREGIKKTYDWFVANR